MFQLLRGFAWANGRVPSRARVGFRRVSARFGGHSSWKNANVSDAHYKYDKTTTTRAERSVCAMVHKGAPPYSPERDCESWR